jgi:hypothetical protein
VAWRGGRAFLESRRFKKIQRTRRFLRTVRVSFPDVEPRKKSSMPTAAKAAIQETLLANLKARSRRPFTGPVAIRLVLQTTDKNPTQSHHVAKNLLDLFSTPTYIQTGRSALLYRDDRQVHALSVTAFHGSSHPSIYLEASRLRDFLEDVRLAADVQMNSREAFGDDEGDDPGDQFRDLRDDASRWTKIYGELGYQTMLRHFQRAAQERVLGYGALSVGEVDGMYNVVRHPFGTIDSRDWYQRMFAGLSLRIRLSALPQVSGSGDVWRSEIDEKIDAFKTKWARLIVPLLTPIAVEVVIKPPPAKNFNALFDLDNVMRTYVVPRVIDKLRPVSHPAFIFNDDVDGTTPTFRVGDHRPFVTPPKSSKFGVTRYEAWRLPEADSVKDAFVTIAVVADLVGVDDIFTRVGDILDEWEEREDDDD